MRKSAYLPEWVFEHASRTPDAPAVADPNFRLTYGELAARVSKMASFLLENGVGPGKHVLLAVPNCPAVVVASLAVQAIGACAVEINPKQDDAARLSILKRVSPDALVLWGRDAAHWGRAMAAASRVELCAVVHKDPLSEKMRNALGASNPAHLLESGDLSETVGSAFDRQPLGDQVLDQRALILFTSGSSGEPRGVIHTFRNIDANTRSIVSYLDLTAQDRGMLILPLSYTFGKSILQTLFHVGGSVFMDNRFMYPQVVMDAMAEESCTGFAGVPTTYELLRRQVDIGSREFPSLRWVLQAGGHLVEDTKRWVADAFSPARFFVMYGQTEATARLSYLPPDRLEEKLSSIGIAIPGVELNVLDDDGSQLAPGEVGNLVARGDNVTPGYFDDPEATAEIIHDGWLWTGDMARMDEEGYFFLTGRKKDFLKIGGHRVSPVEIEKQLLVHPSVLEATVVGVPDDVQGEVAIAFLVAKPDQEDGTMDEKGIQQFFRAKLPPYKVPKETIFVDQMPQNDRGKVSRSELREIYLQMRTK